MILKADEVVGIGHQILLPQLHSRVGLLAVAWVAQTHRLHRPEAKRIAPSAREFLNRQARLEPARLLEALKRNALRADECVVEARILVLAHRAVEIIVAALVVARRAESDFGV